MTEALNDLFTAVVTITLPIVSAMVVNAAQKAANALSAKIENEQIERILAEIPQAVGDAVTMTFQTYVDGLKAAGTFDAAAQKMALQMALTACLKSLSQSAQDYIQETTGDVTGYLTNQIEAEIKRQKLVYMPSTTTATA